MHQQKKSETSNKIVEKLFNKSKKKFFGHEGIHIVGVYDFFDKTNGKPKDSFNLLKYYIRQKFARNFGSTIIAFVLCNFIIIVNPIDGKIGLNREYHLEINPLKEKIYDHDFFKSILEVDKFDYVD